MKSKTEQLDEFVESLREKIAEDNERERLFRKERAVRTKEFWKKYDERREAAKKGENE